jgi:Zn-dependent protease
MGWSLKLGRFLGIDVFVHYTFFFLLGLLVIVYGMDGGPAAALTGLSFTLALFACILLHEFGHALAARAFGAPTLDITLFPFGGLARLVRMPRKPWQEIAVALAGPAVNVIISIGLALYLALAVALSSVSDLGFFTGPFAARLLLANVVLVLFNMLPAFPMDGGRVFRGLLALWLSFANATRIAVRLGQGLAVLFGVFGLWSGNFVLVFIAFVIWQGATQEFRAVRAGYLSGD